MLAVLTVSGSVKDVQQLYTRRRADMAPICCASDAVCTHEPIRANGLEERGSCGCFLAGVGERKGNKGAWSLYQTSATLCKCAVGLLSKCVVSAVGLSCGNLQSMQPVISTGPRVAHMAR
mgnify:FL=1